MPPAVACAFEVREPTPEGWRIAFHLTNHGDQPLHRVHTPRMPYVLHPAEGQVRWSFAVQATDPEVDYWGIEMPTTVALPPGGRWEGVATLAYPLKRTDHFTFDGAGPALTTFELRVEFGVVPFEIVSPRPIARRYDAVVEAQTLCVTAPQRLTRDTPIPARP